jgi:predicted transcriptional regulator
VTGRFRTTRAHPRIQDTVRLSAEGVAKILGDLEARVMHTVWSLREPASARAVHERVYEDHPVALHTVITVLNKLVTKGLLNREKQADLLHYEARLTEREFRERESRRVVEGILSLSEPAITASFVDVLAERHPGQLASLLLMVQQRIEAEKSL